MEVKELEVLANSLKVHMTSEQIQGMEMLIGAAKSGGTSKSISGVKGIHSHTQTSGWLARPNGHYIGLFDTIPKALIAISQY